LWPYSNDFVIAMIERLPTFHQANYYIHYNYAGKFLYYIAEIFDNCNYIHIKTEFIHRERPYKEDSHKLLFYAKPCVYKCIYYSIYTYRYHHQDWNQIKDINPDGHPVDPLGFTWWPGAWPKRDQDLNSLHTKRMAYNTKS